MYTIKKQHKNFDGRLKLTDAEYLLLSEPLKNYYKRVEEHDDPFEFPDDATCIGSSIGFSDDDYDPQF
jgi:hypothetical protein